MQAVVLHGVGEPRELRVEEAPEPQAGPGEVLVRLRAAALNHRDVYICRGQYAGLRFPTILGADGAGEVAAVGEGAALSVGQRIVAYPSLDWGNDERIPGPRFRILGMPDDGTFAQYVILPLANVFPAPPGLTDEEAAAFPLAGLTAYRAVVTRAKVQAGETALVTGIGGGVATCALLFAKALGARVLVTSGSEAKLQRAADLGAAAGFDYHAADWAKAARAAADGRGPDVVIDGTGGATFEQALDVAAPGGRVVSYGATTGDAPRLTVRRIFWKQLDVLGTTMGSPADFRGMLALVQEHSLRPVIDQVFPLADVSAALERMERGDQLGKIVLRIP